MITLIYTSFEHFEKISRLHSTKKRPLILCTFSNHFTLIFSISMLICENVQIMDCWRAFYAHTERSLLTYLTIFIAKKKSLGNWMSGQTHVNAITNWWIQKKPHRIWINSEANEIRKKWFRVRTNDFSLHFVMYFYCFEYRTIFVSKKFSL